MGEEVYTCRHCKKLFTSSMKRQVCEECAKKENELFARIKEYLKQYPNSNAMQIAEGLDINVMSVLYFIDEGRLSMVDVKFSRLEEHGRQKHSPRQVNSTNRTSNSSRQNRMEGEDARSGSSRNGISGSGGDYGQSSYDMPDGMAAFREKGEEA